MIIVMVLAMAIQKTIACGICGGPNAGTYLGVLPQYNKHFVGLRYNYRSFNSTHPNSIIPGLSGRKSAEQFQSTELIGRYIPGKRWQILGSISYQNMKQTIANQTTENNGFSDANFSVYYSVISGRERKNKRWKHLLQTGAGIKLPTGKNTWANETEEYNPNFQMGTGSLDKLVSLIYTVRTKRFGILSDLNLIINGNNQYEYRFGNKYSVTTRFFYTNKWKERSWIAHTGIYFEKSNTDFWKNKTQNNTGGSIVMPLTGFDLYLKGWTVGLNYRLPIWQNLSNGYVKSNARLLASVSILF